MGKINVLDKHVAELIAAGEVVERPSSVIKELVENAIDAGASTITVELKNGGITYMRVTDNGSGIAREDVSNAFLRHATSKVLNQDDLEQIATLGFRGEALASIAAVAHVELLTRTADELAGTRYVIDGGEEQECADAGCAQGTTIVVRDLFYNTPARMKFLKKDVVEANSIAGILDKIALSHPEISFRLLRDQRETLHTPGDGNLKSAVYAVYGKEFTAGLIPVDYELNHIRVSGFVSKPSASRPNRSMQNFFINGRYVKSRTAMVAMEEAFKGSLMVGKVPACVLHINLSCQAVDVNVHPSKIEVRFINERPIFDAVYHAVKTALNQGDTPRVMQIEKPALSPFSQPKEPAPQMVFPDFPATPAGRTAEAAGAAAPQEVQIERDSHLPPVQSAAEENTAPVSKEADKGFSPWKNNSEAWRKPHTYTVGDSGVPLYHRTEVPAPRAEGSTPVYEVKSSAQYEKIPQTELQSDGLHNIIEKIQTETETADTEETVPFAEQKQEPARLVGEAFNTYIILERGRDELLFIDKHAAHERMLYEKLKSQDGAAIQQMLLEPVAVTLDKNEYSAVLESLEICSQAGFEIDDFGSGTVLVRSAPMVLGEDVAGAVMEIAGYLAENRNDITTEKLDWLYHNVACRAAVKAGDESSPQELADLAQRLAEEDIRYCPHGRPVCIVMKRHALEKQFGRIQ